jgi:hypothetical protein
MVDDTALPCKRSIREELQELQPQEERHFSLWQTRSRFTSHACGLQTGCEHLLRVDEVLEPVSAALQRRSSDIPVPAEDGTREYSRRDLLIIVGQGAVPLDDGVPHWTLVGHELGQQDVTRLPEFQAEVRSERGPHITPTEVVTVCDIEGLPGTARGGRCPFGRMGEYPTHQALALMRLKAESAFAIEAPIDGATW